MILNHWAITARAQTFLVKETKQYFNFYEILENVKLYWVNEIQYCLEWEYKRAWRDFLEDGNVVYIAFHGVNMPIDFSKLIEIYT